ncbi:MAG TPA: hypothetical protein VNP36_09135 [Burkholderiales bacterium]|nr:hypothetical protein [Burkholderiales bacterium]
MLSELSTKNSNSALDHIDEYRSGPDSVPRLDRLKEELAYEKFWQGIAVVADISLLGWLVTAADTAPRLTFFLAALGVVLLTW